MNTTKIEWTDRTWNPVTGCNKISPGCDNCYAENIAHRFAGTPAFPNGFTVTLHPDRLDQPHRWRKPSMVFANSMSDLFHPDVPDVYIARVYDAMRGAPQHTFQVLTKRPQRAHTLLRHWAEFGWEPPDNVWLGTSIETATYAFRARHAARTPAAIHFLSCEPLLGPLNDLDLHNIDWVIIGGESGRGARPMDLEWASQLVGRCKADGVAVFVKQLGTAWARHVHTADAKGGDIERWPTSLQIREYPSYAQDAK